MILCVLCLCFVTTLSAGKIWVVIVSGIYPWNDYTYTSEADEYQTYYQFTELGGIPKENIITFAMDNAANNRDNPWPGKVWEYPNGEEVYQYVKDKFDYVYKDNKPDVFLKVLQGINPGVGSGRVVNATEDDVVFVQTLSHGSPGVFYFIQGPWTSYALHTDDVKKAVDNMKAKKKIFYFNSCFSGSFFDRIYPTDGKVVAITGSSPQDEANCCCYNTTTREKFWMDSCLHTRWQLDSRNQIRAKKMSQTSIKEQFDNIVAIKTKDDDFCIYGNLDLAEKTYLSEFQGEKDIDLPASNDDPMCVKDPNTPTSKLGPMFPISLERDAVNRKIWTAFREQLNLEDVDRNELGCSGNENTRVEDDGCLKNMYQAAFEKCNFYTVYEKTNGFHLIDACNQVANQEKITEVLHEICVKQLQIKPEYLIQ